MSRRRLVILLPDPFRRHHRTPWPRPAVLLATVVVGAGCAGSPAPHAVPTTSSTATTAPVVTVPSTSAPAPTTTTTGAPPTTVGPTTTTAQIRPATVVSKGAPAEHVVALTFDAGSDAGFTSQILDELAAQHIVATFGITGTWAQANPGLVRRIAAAGHQIVNHSWDHQSFTGASTGAAPLTAGQITQQLIRTDSIISQLTGAGTAGWFRPPYGDRSPTVDAAAGAAGYRWDLMWTVDTLGWKGVPPATIVQRSLGSLAPGEIILMHVGSASTDAAALPELITAIRAQGYGFVSVGRL